MEGGAGYAPEWVGGDYVNIALNQYPGSEAVLLSNIDCGLKSAYSLINKGKLVSKSQFHSKS